MNATITLTGIQLTASNLPLPDIATWFAWFYERNLDFSAEGNTESGHIVATSYAEEITGEGSAFVATNSSEISSEFGSISGLGGGVHLIDGLELQSVAGEVTASESVNADISVSGVELTVTQGNVIATATSAPAEEILQLSGNPKRYSANQFKYASVKINGIASKITIGNAKALGTVSISATANVQSVGTYLEVPTISAEGILSITEDELVFLMAA
jgi:hypothetical protein